jgi:hypothetical protein
MAKWSSTTVRVVLEDITVPALEPDLSDVPTQDRLAGKATPLHRPRLKTSARRPQSCSGRISVSNGLSRPLPRNRSMISAVSRFSSFRRSHHQTCLACDRMSVLDHEPLLVERQLSARP